MGLFSLHREYIYHHNLYIPKNVDILGNERTMQGYNVAFDGWLWSILSNLSI